MSIICSVDYDTALKYKGQKLSAKYEGKSNKVYLRLNSDDFTLKDCIELAKSSSNILMVNYKGLLANQTYLSLSKDVGVYVGRIIDFGNNLEEDDIERIIVDTPEGVVPVINLPNDYKDIRFLWEMSKRFPRLRFCGGQLFAIEGLKVGAIGVDILDSVGATYDPSAYAINGRIDAIEDVDINTLKIDTKSGAEKQTNTRSSASTTKKTVKKQSVSFADLLSRKSG